MKQKTNPSLPNPEFNVVLLCSDHEAVKEIDRYYQGILACLKRSKRLTAEDKIDQQAFLTREWESELIPFLNLWSVLVYE